MAAKKSFACPACGENVPGGAKACPHCGACEKSGWNENASAGDGLDLPDDDFDYDKFVEEEFGGARKPRGHERLWKIVAIILIVMVGLMFVVVPLFR